MLSWTDSDDQWGPWVPIVPVTVPSVSTAPDAPATATVPSVSTAPDAPAITTVPSVSTVHGAPAISTVPSLSTSTDAPATSPAPLLFTMPSAGSSMGPPAVAVPQIKYAARPGEGRLLDYASSLRLVSIPDFGEGHMVPPPRARLRLLLEVHPIVLGTSSSVCTPATCKDCVGTMRALT